MNESLVSALRTYRTELDQLGALLRLHDITDRDVLIRMWDQLDQIRDTAAVLAREASQRAATMVGFNAETSVADVGAVHTTSQRTEKWDGHRVLSALSTTMIEPETGEAMPAVPLDVLEQVLPAVGPGQTSSKWKRSGLKNVDLDPDNFVQTEYGPQQLRRGPKPKR